LVGVFFIKKNGAEIPPAKEPGWISAPVGQLEEFQILLIICSQAGLPA